VVRKNGTSAPMQLAERAVAHGPAERPAREAESGRRVRAPAAEARGDRDLLVDRHAPLRRRAGGGSQLLERSPHERVLGEALDPEAVPLLERDAVGQRDPLEHRGDFVAPVGPSRADDEREVDFRGSEELGHRRAVASRT
jgi:hypothetical protein